MIAIVSLILVLGISLLITRIATVALVHTGMGHEAARFQARSAFTGVGFTTGEAEAMLSHPVRRRIVMWLMLVGNVGIVTATATLLLSAFDVTGMDGSSGHARQLTTLALGVGLLLLASRSQWVERRLAAAISWALRRFTRIDARDYASLLHLRDEYGIDELAVREGDWIAGKTLGQARIAKEGLVVLGVACPGGSFVGAPGSGTQVRPGDTLLLYGRSDRVRKLDERRAGQDGDACHARAVEAHRETQRVEHVQAGR